MGWTATGFLGFLLQRLAKQLEQFSSGAMISEAIKWEHGIPVFTSSLHEQRPLVISCVALVYLLTTCVLPSSVLPMICISFTAQMYCRRKILKMLLSKFNRTSLIRPSLNSSSVGSLKRSVPLHDSVVRIKSTSLRVFRKLAKFIEGWKCWLMRLLICWLLEKDSPTKVDGMLHKNMLSFFSSRAMKAASLVDSDIFWEISSRYLKARYWLPSSINFVASRSWLPCSPKSSSTWFLSRRCSPRYTSISRRMLKVLSTAGSWPVTKPWGFFSVLKKNLNSRNRSATQILRISPKPSSRIRQLLSKAVKIASLQETASPLGRVSSMEHSVRSKPTISPNLSILLFILALIPKTTEFPPSSQLTREMPVNPCFPSILVKSLLSWICLPFGLGASYSIIVFFAGTMVGVDCGWGWGCGVSVYTLITSLGG